MFMQDASRFALDFVTPVAGLSPRIGLTTATLVETVRGWTTAEALQIGMDVFTAEGSTRPVLALDRAILIAGTELVRLPGASFDNCDSLDLLPDQDLVLENADGAMVRIAARYLVGTRGAHLIRTSRDHEVITPIFAEDEVIWVNSGTRLYCAGLSAAGEAGFVSRCEAGDLIAILADLGRGMAA